MYTEDVFAHISQGVKQREGWKRTRVFPLGDWVSYRRAVPHTPFCSAVSSPAQHIFAVTRWTCSLHSLWLLLFSPSKPLLSASTTPSISEVKFPINSVCWSSRIFAVNFIWEKVISTAGCRHVFSALQLIQLYVDLHKINIWLPLEWKQKPPSETVQVFELSHSHTQNKWHRSCNPE